MKELKQTVANLQKAEAAINQDESDLETKKLRLVEKRQELEKTTEDSRKLQVKIQTEIEKSESIDIHEDNVLEFVKPSTGLHEVWLKKEAKKKSIDECMLELKKMYEDRNITLPMLLDSVRRLSFKEFMCIYKKAKAEGLAKKQDRTK